MRNRLFFGNFTDRDTSRDTDGKILASPGKRRLVEECETIRVGAVQRAFGKKALLEAIRGAEPLRLPVLGGHFDVWFIDALHRLPGQSGRWSSWEEGNTRLWLVCTRCRQPVARLYYYSLPGSSGLSELWCRRCHGLTYQSVNCGKNRWYREVARPMKRLLKEKARLLARKPTARIQARLTELELLMQILRERAKPKTSPPRRPRRPYRRPAVSQRRPYRDLSLIGDVMGNPCVARPSRPTSVRNKPLGQQKSLLREPEPDEMEPVLEAWRQAELGMVLKLLPLAEKAVQEAERSPEWAGSLKLARVKQGLEETRTLLEQQGRTEPKQRAGS